jgi:hypothetical protein
MQASRMDFIVLAPMMGMCLLLCLLIQDRGLQRPEEREMARVKAAEREEENRMGGGERGGAVNADAGGKEEDGSTRTEVPPDKALVVEEKT